MKKLFLFLTLSMTMFAKEININKGIVKVFMTISEYDFARPWSPPRQVEAFASGFTIKGKEIVTNAHVAANISFVQVKKAGDHKRYTAKVKRVANDIDLAILTVADKEFWHDVEELEIADTPKVGDEVKVYGFPWGGNEMSLTKGVVSRVEMSTAVHSGSEILAYEMDANIEGGNSGGPVIGNEKVVGVSFQGWFFRNGGHAISAEVLKTFLATDKKGQTFRVPELGLKVQNLENNYMKQELGLKSKDSGVFVTAVAEFSDANDIIKVGDVLVSIDGKEIANDMSIELRPGERTSYTYLFKKNPLGSKVKVKLLRKGKEINKTITLTKTVGDIKIASETLYDQKPTYLIKGGLVFQPLVRNIVGYWGRMQEKELDKMIGESKTKETPNVIILETVLTDDLNAGYRFKRKIVEEINGVEIKSMEDIVKGFKVPKGAYHNVKLKDESRISIPVKDLDKKTQEICKNYGIEKTHSDDLKL